MPSPELLTQLSVDIDARVTLREFAELEWQPTPDQQDEAQSSAMSRTPDKRYSWLRKARSRGRPLPPPVGGSSRASLYRLGDLVSWIRDAGGPGGVRVEVRYDPAWALRTAASAYVDEHRGYAPSEGADGQRSPRDDLRHFLLGALLLFTADRGRPPLSEEIETLLITEPTAELPTRLQRFARSEGSPRRDVAAALLQAVPARSAAAGRAARAVAAALASGDPAARLVTLVFDTLTGLDVRAGTTTTTGSLAQLLVGLGDPRPGETVVDPACGEGQLLLAAFGRQPDASLVGRDHDPIALLSARAVLDLNGAAADLDDGPTDSLADSTAIPEGDLVLLDPPLGAGHAVRWLRLAVQLSPAGRAVVVLPGSSLQPHRREWAELGANVTAVIAGPARLRTDTGEAPAIWLLDQRAPSDQLAIVDASGLGEGGFTRDDAERLADAIRRWTSRGQFEAPDGTRGIVAAHADIATLDGELRLEHLDAITSAPDPATDIIVDFKRISPAQFSSDPPSTAVLARDLLAALAADRTANAVALRRALERYLEGL